MLLEVSDEQRIYTDSANRVGICIIV